VQGSTVKKMTDSKNLKWRDYTMFKNLRDFLLIKNWQSICLLDGKRLSYSTFFSSGVSLVAVLEP
jgi:hypothetical protein